jgi:DNA-binding protein H-NS
MEDFAKGMGMSVEEYMEYLAPTVQKELSIAKLQQSILQSASIDIRDNSQKAEEYFNKQKEEIKKNYDVKYSEDAKKILEN